MEAFAARTQDWADIETIVLPQSDLDRNYIFERSTPLADAKQTRSLVQ